MFEDYEEYFYEPSEAEEIIQKATDDLKNLLTEAAKNVIEQAASAREELETLKSNIREKKNVLSKIEEQITEAEKRAEAADRYDIPRKYIDRFVREQIGDYAPGDTVFVLESKSEPKECPLCNGQKKIHIAIGDSLHDVDCPDCNGVGTIYPRRWSVAERMIADIYLKLCFDKDGRTRLWSSENIFLVGTKYSVPLKSLYKTREEAEAALAERAK